jgi:ABC-type multidrug transport system ATPase subunit
LVDGSVLPTAGRVKRGKTVKTAKLAQRLDELDKFADDPVRVMVGQLKATYAFGSGSKTQELTPSQLLERLGFASAQLSTPVRDLSGGQKRRLQLLLVLLGQPNLLMLDEPTNDLDTDMLAALEDVLDSWPGTLLVVSHDRYFLERVTDQQYALLDGKLRHLPGGVDEYLRLRAATATAAEPTRRTVPEEPAARRSGAAERSTRKEIGAAERRLDRLAQQVADLHGRMAAHDQSDYEGVSRLNGELLQTQAEIAALEERWLELSELVG